MGVFDVVVVFDNTSNTFEEKINTQKKLINFRVISAAPGYKTADDAIVHWA